MKIRQGFVSNSSSSSFICMVSGNIEAGYDMNMEDAGYVGCVNDHTFMENYMTGDWADQERVDDWRYEVPARHCPICTLKHITDQDFLKYIVKMENIDMDIMKDKLRNRFGNWKELQEVIG